MASTKSRPVAGLSGQPFSESIVTRKSEFNSTATLFTLDNEVVGSKPLKAEEGEESTSTTLALRRSPRKRVKREVSERALSSDIEDIVTDDAEYVVPPLLAAKNRVQGRAALKGRGKLTRKRASPTVKKEEELDVNLKKEEEEELKFDGIPASARPPTPSSSSKTKLEDVGYTATSPTKKKGKAKAVPTSLATPHPAPEHWEEVYGLIKDMRTRFVAPVDTMGCEQAQFKETEPKNRRFATLVSLMLSSQTKDEVTDAAVTKLRAAVGGTLSVENVIRASPTVISEAIAKVGFWRRKTDYIKQTAEKLRDSFDSEVPKTADELCSLPGVGPKMAFLTLQVAWDLNLGIGVDVHVHRITNRLGWHKKPTKNPEETRLNLQSWLPKEFHKEINHMLVGFGQVVCLPVGPKCGECVLSTKGLCPSRRLEDKTKKGRKRKVDESNVEIKQEIVKIEVEVEDENSS